MAPGLHQSGILKGAGPVECPPISFDLICQTLRDEHILLLSYWLCQQSVVGASCSAMLDLDRMIFILGVKLKAPKMLIFAVMLIMWSENLNADLGTEPVT